MESELGSLMLLTAGASKRANITAAAVRLGSPVLFFERKIQSPLNWQWMVFTRGKAFAGRSSRTSWFQRVLSMCCCVAMRSYYVRCFSTARVCRKHVRVLRKEEGSFESRGMQFEVPEAIPNRASRWETIYSSESAVRRVGLKGDRGRTTIRGACRLPASCSPDGDNASSNVTWSKRLVGHTSFRHFVSIELASMPSGSW